MTDNSMLAVLRKNLRQVPSLERTSDPARLRISVAAGLLAFLYAYFHVPGAVPRQAMLYLLVPFGLAAAFPLPRLILPVNFLGLLLLFFTVSPLCPLTAWSLSFLFCGTAVIPFYYHHLKKTDRARFHDRCHLLLRRSGTLEDALRQTEAQRCSLDAEIEKINQLYLLGRELVEHVETDEVLEHLQRVLLGRPGIRAVSIFSRGQNDWKGLCFSDPRSGEKWTDLLRSHPGLRGEKRFRLLPSPEWLDGLSAVFWPVRLDKDLLAAILLAIEPEHAPRAVEEGEIFIPQIALGLKRTRLFSEVQERSRHDGLTGLYLRRYFLERLTTEIQRAKRYSTAFSLLMVDIDRFKSVNDAYGHLMGDKVLCTAARVMVDCVRPGDLVGRFGGEEFVILLPMASKEETLRIAGEIGRFISRKEFASGDSKFHVTVSIGISRYPEGGARPEDLIQAADQALYWVKSNGRNGIKD